MRVRKQLTEADWDAVPSSAKIRRRVDLSNLGRRPSVDKRQKTVSMLVAGLLVHPVREPADEHPLNIGGPRRSVFCESCDHDRHHADCRKTTSGALHGYIPVSKPKLVPGYAVRAQPLHLPLRRQHLGVPRHDTRMAAPAVG
jgi:hypothetical protein